MRFHDVRAPFWTTLSLCAALTLLAGCGKDDETPPVQSPGTVPTATPTPMPSATPTPEPTSLRQGLWGGNGIEMHVSNGGATYQLDCAHGTISGHIYLDDQGRFEKNGTIIIEHGGPSMPGEILPSFPARHEGKITGNHMKLEINYRNSANENVHYDFELDWGAMANLHRCL